VRTNAQHGTHRGAHFHCIKPFLENKDTRQQRKDDLVSRKAATKGIGATVKAQVTIAYARNEAPPPPNDSRQSRQITLLTMPGWTTRMIVANMTAFIVDNQP